MAELSGTLSSVNWMDFVGKLISHSNWIALKSKLISLSVSKVTDSIARFTFRYALNALSLLQLVFGASN